MAPSVNPRNTILINGHYDKLEKETHKGDISYDLYLKGNEDFYKIAADNSDCFYSGSFQNAIKNGQAIQIYLMDSFWRKAMIVCIVSNNQAYLSFDCANQEIKKERILMPLLILFFGLIVNALVYKKELRLR